MGGWIAGVVALMFVAIVFIRQALGRLMAPLALGGVVAATAMYLVIGLTRADLPRLVVLSQPEIPRDPPVETLGAVLEEDLPAVTSGYTAATLVP